MNEKIAKFTILGGLVLQILASVLSIPNNSLSEFFTRTNIPYINLDPLTITATLLMIIGFAMLYAVRHDNLDLAICIVLAIVLFILLALSFDLVYRLFVRYGFGQKGYSSLVITHSYYRTAALFAPVYSLAMCIWAFKLYRRSKLAFATVAITIGVILHLAGGRFGGEIISSIAAIISSVAYTSAACIDCIN